jgi:hypothetical protein
MYFAAIICIAPNVNVTEWKQLRNLRLSIVCVVAENTLACHDISVQCTATYFKDQNIQDEFFLKGIRRLKDSLELAKVQCSVLLNKKLEFRDPYNVRTKHKLLKNVSALRSWFLCIIIIIIMPTTL